MNPAKFFRNASLCLLICAAGSLLFGCKGSPRHKTPTTTYAVIQHAILDLSKEEFADTLVKYFGTTRREAKKVISYAEDHNDREVVAAEALVDLEESMKDLENGDPKAVRERFAVEVVAPFLQRTLHDAAVPDALRDRIVALYSTVFGIGQGQNGLRAVSTSMRSYRSGGSFHVDSLNLFNRQMLTGGFLFQLNNRYQQACLLEVSDTILPPRKWKDSTLWIYETRRAAPCFLGNEMGFSVMKTPYVVVVKEKIEQEAVSVAVQADTAWPGTLYPDRRYAERLWESLGMRMERAEADQILLDLQQRDFRGKNLETIANEMEFETAVHEAKHKTDDIELPTMILNSDCEVSAHLTQAICGASPFHGLVEAIQRMEGFYATSGDPVLANLLVRLWEIAHRARKPPYSADSLRQDLTGVYADFVTESSKTSLPPLEPFRTQIVPAIRSRVLKTAGPAANSGLSKI